MVLIHDGWVVRYRSVLYRRTSSRVVEGLDIKRNPQLGSSYYYFNIFFFLTLSSSSFLCLMRYQWKTRKEKKKNQAVVVLSTQCGIAWERGEKGEISIFADEQDPGSKDDLQGLPALRGKKKTNLLARRPDACEEVFGPIKIGVFNRRKLAYVVSERRFQNYRSDTIALPLLERIRPRTYHKKKDPIIHQHVRSFYFARFQIFRISLRNQHRRAKTS